MSCSRSCCESIMCDTYVYDVGYVCGECQNEFETYIEKMDDPPKTEGQIKKELKTFMDTDKDYYFDGDEMNVSEFFSSYKN